jgi:hypothetical protein
MGRTTAAIITADGERHEFPVPIDSTLMFDFGSPGLLMEVETTTLEAITRDES